MSRKPRKQSWFHRTDAERTLFLSLIDRHLNVLEGYAGLRTERNLAADTWTKIAEEVNLDPCCTVKASGGQYRGMWNTVKGKVRKELKKVGADSILRDPANKIAPVAKILFKIEKLKAEKEKKQRLAVKSSPSSLPEPAPCGSSSSQPKQALASPVPVLSSTTRQRRTQRLPERTVSLTKPLVSPTVQSCGGGEAQLHPSRAPFAVHTPHPTTFFESIGKVHSLALYEDLLRHEVRRSEAISAMNAVVHEEQMKIAQLEKLEKEISVRAAQLRLRAAEMELKRVMDFENLGCGIPPQNSQSFVLPMIKETDP